MAKEISQYWRLTMRNNPDEPLRVVLRINGRALAHRLGVKAIKSKSGKATALHGAITVEVLRDQPANKENS